MTPPNTPPIIPCCPHCKAELAAPGLYNWSAGPFMLLGVYCLGCKAVLKLDTLPAMMGEQSRLVEPS
jgi:hypothetical protein